MDNKILLVGVGEMGSVFARGFLRTGYTVQPILRNTNMQAIAQSTPEPLFVLVSVAESDLHPALESLPKIWHDRVVLLQNELLPKDWQTHQLNKPTVISVWFEKKKGQDVKVLIPSPVHGPHQQIIVDALASIDIPSKLVATEQAMLEELVIKNVYILTTNIAGLVVGGNVEQLWKQHNTLAREVAQEVINLQQHLTGQSFQTEQLINGMVTAFEGDWAHKCMGRSAPARLERALDIAKQFGIATPKLQEIANQN